MRQAVLICDAPGHGAQFGEEGTFDRFPDETPDRLKVEELMHLFAENNINFSVCRLHPKCDKMINIMKDQYKVRNG